MNKEIYEDIIYRYLLPYVSEHHTPDNVVIHQDNDSKHTSHVCKKALERIKGYIQANNIKILMN